MSFQATNTAAKAFAHLDAHEEALKRYRQLARLIVSLEVEGGLDEAALKSLQILARKILDEEEQG